MSWASEGESERVLLGHLGESGSFYTAREEFGIRGDEGQS